MSTVEIDAARFLEDLKALREFGRDGGGVHRVAYSAPDRESRAWLLERMRDAGLEARIDGVGNVIGRTTASGPAVVIASHTDTVPHGGWLDGAYGVIAGLEVARAAQQMEVVPAIEVISFADEEGAFYGTLGSSVFCGIVSPEHLADLHDEDGRVWRTEVAEAGYRGSEVARLDPARHKAYFELHIEQGPILEGAQLQIGTVTGIVGMRRHQVVFHGRADHAGATPMGDRLDAGTAAIRSASEILDFFVASHGDDTVWNIGAMRFEPGAGNVVPESAEFLIEFRDTSARLLDDGDTAIASIVSRVAEQTGCAVSRTTVVNAPPVAMDAAMMDVVETSAAARGLSHQRMPSAAGHDAMNVALQVPTGMIFVPSIAGRSHHHAEDTNETDLVNGLEVLASAVMKAVAS